MANDRETWLSAGEAARELGVGTGVLVSWIESGQIPAEETSAGIVLVRRADVERVRERERTPVAVRLQHV